MKPQINAIIDLFEGLEPQDYALIIRTIHQNIEDGFLGESMSHPQVVVLRALLSVADEVEQEFGV